MQYLVDLFLHFTKSIINGVCDLMWHVEIDLWENEFFPPLYEW